MFILFTYLFSFILFYFIYYACVSEFLICERFCMGFRGFDRGMGKVVERNNNNDY